MMRHTRVLFFLLILLSGCESGNPEIDKAESGNPEIDKAEQILASMNCEVPSDVHLFTPLLDIGFDSEKEILVKEYIELERRKPINEGDWRVAAIMFYWSQEDLAKEKITIATDKEFIRHSIQLRKLNQLDMNVAEMAEERQKLFVKNCNRFIKDNKKMAPLSEELTKLRAEKNKPWLDDNKKLPCYIQNKEGCYM